MKVSNSNCLYDLDQGPGYSLYLSLEPNELAHIREEITAQWIYRLQILNKLVAAKIIKNDISIEDYHVYSSLLDHAKTWPKITRILPPKFISTFLSFVFVKKLNSIFGDFEISDEEDLGWPNIYWRIVRPNEKGDIGPLHRDSWFWKLNSSFPKPEFQFRRVKVWIPIYTEIGMNGLLVEKYSQNRTDIEWASEIRHGIQKPILLTKKESLEPTLLNALAGEAILFHDELLHGGAVNRGNKCRVSIEFTLLVKLKA